MTATVDFSGVEKEVRLDAVDTPIEPGDYTPNLVSEVLTPAFSADDTTIGLDAMDDGAVLPLADEHLVVTTDSHVIYPPFFPGGDIGPPRGLRDGE